MKIPVVFKNIICRTYGRNGEEWLKKLPEIVEFCSNEWNLKNISALSKLSYNYVAFVEHELHGRSILKIGVPEHIINREYETINAIKSTSLRKVHLYDQEHNALLLEAIEPGTRLSDSGSIEFELQTGCMLLENMKNETKNSSYLPPYKELMNAAFELALQNKWGGGVFKGHMETAVEYFNILESRYKADYIIHGDFHSDNVLSNNSINVEEQWKVIDPKGVVGFWFADIGRFILNLIWRSAQNEIIKSTRRLIFHAADFLQLPFSAVRRILFIETVLCYAWKFQEQYDEDRYFLNVENMQRDLSLIEALDNKR